MNRTLLLPALLLSACSSPSGIWLLEVPWEDGGGCETTISENFVDGYVPGQAAGDASAWTYADAYQGADSISFAQIETYGSGTAVLVVGTEAYPGVKEDGGWVFTFEKETVQADWADHDSGYGWKTTQSVQSGATFTFTFEGADRAQVEVEGSSTDTLLWEETDEWDLEEVGVYSQVPFEDYIVYDDEDGYQREQENEPLTQDCVSEICQLEFKTTCSSSGEFTATRTDYDNSDYYDYLSGVGQ